MTPMFARVPILARLGRRGLVLSLFGVAWLIQGSAFFVLPGMGGGSSGFWVDQLPQHVRGGLWLIAGTLSLVAALQTRRKSDTFGFLAVSSMPLILTASFFMGFVARVVTGDPTWVVGLLGFSIWGVIALALGVIASWPEVPQAPITDDEGG